MNITFRSELLNPVQCDMLYDVLLDMLDSEISGDPDVGTIAEISNELAKLSDIKMDLNGESLKPRHRR